MSDTHVEAVVQVGSEETRYLRRGRGAQAVVVLAEDDTERERMIERLSGRSCVIAPVLLSSGRFEAAADTTARGIDDAAKWLLGVIDGLGLERPGVVLAPSLAYLAPILSSGCGDAVMLLDPGAEPG